MTLAAKAILAAAVSIGALLAASDAVYWVGPSQSAVVSRTGRPAVLIEAGPGGEATGPHLKWPLVDRVARFDRRDLTAAVGTPAVTRDGKRLSIGVALRYRIADPLRFQRAFGTQAEADLRLQPLLERSVGEAVAGAPLDGVVADAQAQVGRPALARAQALAAAQGLGLQAIDLRVVRIGLSGLDAETAAHRMQDEAAAQTVAVRADGEARKRDLAAAADRDAAGVRGEGERQALEVRGQGDAERASILAAAYGKDPAFARFFRRLEAYDQALNPQTTTLVLSPDGNAFLRLFAEGPDAAKRR